MPLEDKYPVTSTTWSIKPIRHSLHLSIHTPFLWKFRKPQVESYDRAKDPLDHLESFKTLMHLRGVADEIMCRAFLTMLKGPARIWLSKLTPNSISTFKELSAQFASHFIGGRRYKKSTTCLMSIKQ